MASTSTYVPTFEGIPMLEPISAIKFIDIIGTGEYGLVTSAVFRGHAYAIKITKFAPWMIANKTGIVQEIKTLSYLNQYDLPIPRLHGVSFVSGTELKTVLPAAIWTNNRLLSESSRYALLYMTYIRGSTLDTIARRAPLPDETIQQIAIWLFQVLAKLHSLGIVHRDVKTDNIIVMPNGEYRLIDYGFACSPVNAALLCNRTQVGSPQYSAPELFSDTFTVAGLPAADVWAAGVTIYELINRDGDNGSLYPWGVTDAEAALYPRTPDLIQFYRKRLLTEPMNPSRATLPSLDSVLKSSLVANPAERSTADEIYEELTH